MPSFRMRTWTGLLAALALAGCPAENDDSTDAGREDGDVRDEGTGDVDAPDVPEVVVCTPDLIQCVGGNAQTCNATGDGWESTEECVDPTPVCVPEVGCRACRPDETECVSDSQARRCASDGSAWVTDDCDPTLGEHCEGGVCTDLTPACAEAAANNSYEACDYWGTQTANSQIHDMRHDYLDVIRFAFVIGNRQATEAHVQVQGPSGVIAEATVLPNSTQTIELDWNDALMDPEEGTEPPVQPPISALVPGAAFRVKSDVPVTVYQHNPLKYQAAVLIYSNSNDASLLLPKHVLTGNYMIASRATHMWRQSNPAVPEDIQYFGLPGFFAVVGVEDDTDVTVRFTAHTTAGTTASGIEAYAPGETATFRVDKFDVLQILSAVPETCTVLREETHPSNPYLMAGYCDLGADYDLTGTLIQATRPVAVFGGHDCTFIPYDRWACDHLEEQMLPLETWGGHYLVSRPDPVTEEQSIYRVISREDDNRITFMPDAWVPVTLDRGEWTEIESDLDFEIEGTEPLLAVQYLVGQGTEHMLDGVGDPSMSLAVPVDQYRTAYNFLAPTDYVEDVPLGQHGENWVNVIAPTGAEVLLDTEAVTGFTALGDSGFGAARVQIEGGSHAITSTEEFGITCYGYGNYTSYMYPGGLDLDPISPFI